MNSPSSTQIKKEELIRAISDEVFHARLAQFFKSLLSLLDSLFSIFTIFIALVAEAVAARRAGPEQNTTSSNSNNQPVSNQEDIEDYWSEHSPLPVSLESTTNCKLELDATPEKDNTGELLNPTSSVLTPYISQSQAPSFSERVQATPEIPSGTQSTWDSYDKSRKEELRKSLARDTEIAKAQTWLIENGYAVELEKQAQSSRHRGENISMACLLRAEAIALMEKRSTLVKPIGPKRKAERQAEIEEKIKSGKLVKIGFIPNEKLRQIRQGIYGDPDYNPLA